MKKELIKEKYIELVIKNQTVKIKVQDLCETCGISRTTFYKYFKDCNNIIEYILTTDAISSTYTLLESKALDNKSVTTNWYLSFYKHQEFYIIAIRDNSQNSLFDTVIELLSEQNRKIIESYKTSKKYSLSPTDIDYYSYKLASTQAMLLKKWMIDGMRVSPEKMAEYFLGNLNIDKSI